MSVGRELLKELRENEDLRNELALELMPVLFKNRRLRLTVLTSLYRDIATKDDMRELRDRINLLEQRVARIEGQLNLFIKLFIVFNLPILLGIIGILI
ncbi:MAG: hypothetical protein DRJ45_07210 [Thermoprotei archaeon]|nr:MAG: hypothetical protein DRJ45_07210 [Thermoprotei archaeon]